jgi:hypothetical protein
MLGIWVILCRLLLRRKRYNNKRAVPFISSSKVFKYNLLKEYNFTPPLWWGLF